MLFTYTATAKESPVSAEFIQNCPAGFVPQVTVASAGAPAGATNYAVYASVMEGAETLQQATKTTTALGANFTLPNPLINPSGITRAASNANSGIAGLTLHDSGALYATGVGGSNTAGGINQLLGTWGNPPPLGGFDAAQALVVPLILSQAVEISLKQPWTSGLSGSQAGLTLDTSQQAAGVFIADTTATACLTILERLDLGGAVNDTGARVRAIFNAAAVI